VEAFYDRFVGDSIAFTVRFWIAFHDGESEFRVAGGEAVKKIKHVSACRASQWPDPDDGRG
jgi:hypothetical protein